MRRRPFRDQKLSLLRNKWFWLLLLNWNPVNSSRIARVLFKVVFTFKRFLASIAFTTLFLVDIFMPNQVCYFANSFPQVKQTFSLSFSSPSQDPIWCFNNTSFLVHSFWQLSQIKLFTSPPFLPANECLCLLCLCLNSVSQKFHLNCWFSLFITTAFAFITA